MWACSRNDFIGATRNFKFERRHIIYAGEDVAYLEDIKKAQQVFIDKYDMGHVIYNIEFPLCLYLIKTEMEGIPFNVEQHMETIVENEKRKIDLELSMDQEVRLLTEHDPN